VAVRAEDDPLASGDAFAHRAEHRGVLRRQSVSHRIGQVDGRSAFRDGHFHYLAEVVEIGPARVFGGELDVVGVAPRLADGLARQFEGLFASQPELVLEVKLRGRDEDVEPGARRITDRIACERDVLGMTARERRQYWAPDFARDLLHAAEVALRGGGEAGLDDIDPKSIELAGEASFSSGVMVLPGACSPSRRVVSKMRTSFSIASLVSLEAKKKTADLFGVRGGKGSMLYRLCCLPVNAAIPAEAPKEDQDEANKDEEQQG
jgi:hypothetical protein